MVEAIEFLKARNDARLASSCCTSTSARRSRDPRVKNALREAGRFYVELHKLGAPLEYLDVGGGLGVDYDGSQTNFDVVDELHDAGVRQRHRLRDQGDLRRRRAFRTRPSSPSRARAVVAHHSVLVVDILGVTEFDVGKVAARS